MTDADREREDAWSAHKLECLARYVSRLNRQQQIEWADKQTEKTRELVKNAIIEQRKNETT